jgi:hypothetical protein
MVDYRNCSLGEVNYKSGRLQVFSVRRQPTWRPSANFLFVERIADIELFRRKVKACQEARNASNRVAKILFSDYSD